MATEARLSNPSAQGKKAGIYEPGPEANVPDSALVKADVIDAVALNASDHRVTLYLVAADSWDGNGDAAMPLHSKLKNQVASAA